MLVCWVGFDSKGGTTGFRCHSSLVNRCGTDTALAGNYLLIFGDLNNYVVARRLGFTVEVIQHLFATANNRPTGQRGLFGHARFGADSVNDTGMRMLNVTWRTSA